MDRPTADFTLGPDEVDDTQDAGIVRPSRSVLGERVWNDVDGDGVQDQGERGVANVTVRLLDASGAVVATTATDAAGQFVFARLADGAFRLEFDAPDGFEFTLVDQGTDDERDSDADPATGRSPVVTLAPDELNLDVDAGLRPASTGGPTIGDFAWDDLDRDGIQEPGEPGLANVTVTLRDPGGTVLATTTTDAGGQYGFTNVAPGSYRLRFTVPAGLQTTPSDVGSDDTVDSDINAGGETRCSPSPPGRPTSPSTPASPRWREDGL